MSNWVVPLVNFAWPIIARSRCLTFLHKKNGGDLFSPSSWIFRQSGGDRGYVPDIGRYLSIKRLKRLNEVHLIKQM